MVGRLGDQGLGYQVTPRQWPAWAPWRVESTPTFWFGSLAAPLEVHQIAAPSLRYYPVVGVLFTRQPVPP